MTLFVIPRLRGRLIGTAAVATLSLMALTACTPGGGAADPDSPPAEGGTLRVLLAAQATCIDPAVAFSQNERAIARPIADSLVSMDRDTGEIKSWLAEKWEVNENSTEFTFHLRGGATFSDGTPVDAEAVKSTLDYLTENLLTSSFRGAGYLRNYVKTEVVDAQTARVVLGAPAPHFLAGATTNTLGILSVSSAKKTRDERCAGDYIGSGPFTLDQYTQGQTAKLVKRRDYQWGNATADHEGPAHLDAINFQIVNVSNARSGSLQSGQADVVIDVAKEDIPVLEKSATVMFGTQPGMAVSLLANSARPGLRDTAMLEALRTGFDRSSAVKAILGDHYAAASSVLTTNLPQYKDESTLLEFNPERAEKALTDAGWVAGSDGVREKDGVRAEFDLNFTSTYGAPYSQMLQLFQQQMKDLGIVINLNDLLQAGLLQTISTHDYDFYVTSLTDVDPDIVRSTATRILDAETLKSSGVLALFDATTQETDPSARAALFGDVQDALIEQGFVIPLWEAGQLVASGRKVQHLGMDFQGYLDFYDTSLAK
ncbi:MULTISPECIES: ABC transporter substrate-binding protein [unclassified Pseudarthrobacter]|uniref:ABC transporter substrate-binding protein n=1 Tax=unclassified Pseudarthrobacter TaxID=2647000 RepID=UPI003076D53D